MASTACHADTCCVWSFISQDLANLFLADDGTCNPLARQAVRFGFHDAAAWSTTSGIGGADGSLLLSPDEINRSENNGMQQIQQTGLQIIAKYAALGYVVGAADLAQYMHNLATVVCPLGPRSFTFVGRIDSAVANPTGLIPNVNQSAPDLVQLFVDKTFRPQDLIALIGAHTVANQFFDDPSPANVGKPLDSTPGIWDVKFYSQGQGNPPQ